jgi:NifU-like protein involved in Fe-S cluster formation
MDEAVIKFYRRLLRTDFEHAGELKNPTIFLDSVGEKIQICSQFGRDYMHLYINIREDVIEDVKYLCTCDPTANVAVEILCSLIKGKTLEQVKSIREEDFCRSLNCEDAEFRKKARGLLELLHRGLGRFLTESTGKTPSSG